MSAIAAAGLGALTAGLSLGDTFANWGISRNLNDQTQEQSLSRMAQQYDYDRGLFNLQSAFNSAEADKSRNWQEMMSSTAYQRAIADMERAGINPASLGGAQISGASTPSGASASASLPSVGGSGSSSASFHGSNMSGVLGQLASTALYGMFAKDRQASLALASEIQDNAKHAYKMQEINERINGNKAVQELRNQSNERIAKNRNQSNESIAKNRNQSNESIAKNRNQNITNNKKADRELREELNRINNNAMYDRTYMSRGLAKDLELLKKKLNHRNYR